jgi:hypothetical protein
MTLLVARSGIFLGIYFPISGTALRAKVIQLIGERPKVCSR